MMYPKPHVRMTWGGTMYRTANAWQNNLRILNPHVIDGKMNMSEWEAESILAPLFTTLSTTSGLMHEDIEINYITFSLIAEDGHVMDQMPYQLDGRWTRDQLPGVRYPPHVALALTFKSDSTTRLARQGRIYLPIPDLEIGQDGLTDESQTANAVSQYAFLIRGINQAVSQFWPQAHVGLVSDQHEGHQAQIVSVSAGRLLDSMGSRKDRFYENFVERDTVADATPVQILDPADYPDFFAIITDRVWDEFNGWLADIIGV